MTIRRQLLTGDPILFAPGRARRPNAFAPEGAGCPFCRGEEAQTPPTIASIETDDGWIARAFANKYPAVEGHEVIVESPHHEQMFDKLADPEASVRLMLMRYRAHPTAAHVALFKNHGRRAGASLEHEHSQLVPTSFVPPRIAREAAAFGESCPLCDPGSAGELIDETDAFVWLAPHGSVMAHQTWLVPKAHHNEPGFDVDVGELAHALQRAARSMLQISDSYNWSFTTFRCEPRAHWYVDLFPRLTTIAGFELGTGTFISIIDPTETARRCRQIAP